MFENTQAIFCYLFPEKFTKISSTRYKSNKKVTQVLKHEGNLWPDTIIIICLETVIHTLYLTGNA